LVNFAPWEANDAQPPGSRLAGVCDYYLYYNQQLTGI